MLTIIILCTFCYGLWLIPPIKFNMTKYSVVVAWLLHTYICFYHSIGDQGWLLNIANSVLMVSWLSVLIVFIFKINSPWVKIPLVIFVLASLFLIKFNPGVAYDQYIEFSWQLDLHISLSMLSFSVLSVASLYAVSLWFCIKNLKNPSSVTTIRMVSLIDEEKKLFNLIFLGWLILTTSLISGVIFIENFMQQHLGHKVVFSLLAWLIFGILILKRLTKGLRGEKLITLTITGMTLLATGYLGSKIVLEWLLQK